LAYRTGVYLEESDVCSHLVGRKIEKECHEIIFGVPGIGIFTLATTLETFIHSA
jgi:hypothetical protein